MSGRAMPTFSPDPVVDFLVAEAVVRAGQEAEREANEKASAEATKKQQIEGHRDRAIELGMV